VRNGVGVNNSAPIEVTVGVNVSGVGVEVANRFCVGMGVCVGAGVSVSVGGGAVGVAMNGGMLIGGIPEQPARKIPRTRV
jgi:hypothetical protein